MLIQLFSVALRLTHSHVNGTMLVIREVNDTGVHETLPLPSEMFLGSPGKEMNVDK